MTIAYVDSSWALAVAFGERGAAELHGRYLSFERRVSSNLLEAELRSAFAREGSPFDLTLTAEIEWVLPQTPLSTHIARVLETGYLRGADLWHVACALSIADPPELTFLTLDVRQRTVAKALGFKV